VSNFNLSIVIPIYNNEDSLSELLLALSKVQNELDFPLEVVFVIDGSPDNSHSQLLKLIPIRGISFQVLTLSRNFGSFAAIREGFRVARGAYIACISADLQEPPSIFPDFYRALNGENVDVVVGKRISRNDGLISDLSSKLFWRMFRKFVSQEVPYGGVDVFAFNRKVLKQVLLLAEQNTSLIGLIYWVGFERSVVDYERIKRKHGKSGWTLRKKFRYFEDSIFSFTNLPIISLQVIGGLGIIFSSITATIVFIFWLNSSIPIPGYTPLIITILASTSSILLGLGIVGSYTWRAYENTKNRPGAIISSHQEY
jgi:glycosyltransferase involved in cell wall biosynthesis